MTPDPIQDMVPEPYRVRARRPDRGEAVTLTLEPAGGGAAPPFRPGQFTMIYAPGVGEIPVSISGRARHGGYLQTVRDVGAVSHALCRAGRGDVVGVRGPFGTSWDLAAAEGMDVIVAAGGLGLAPLRPVIRGLLAARARYRRIAVLVGARDPGGLIYPREPARWARHCDVRLTVDRPDRTWSGHTGLVTTLLDTVGLAPERTYAYVCGPEVMMRATAGELLRRGVPAGRIALSLERNMKCGIGRCGHCQLGPLFTCLDGPVLSYAEVAALLEVSEL
ncbi:FAD/NAD(P)-binding protein [Actinomadura sp. ATCC 31491]|uniref:FAD/NAD(P)-binding protein n=1 Tax=Actinomadura luzonensis TaxID=2805427 RepID=A0ABT0FU99_9ACTN|nr:FAD/NAD(P)-binding protein [Actinomadura luzonensis]MCK2215922.1 FAD/NAD(P)-binding protein [Actinomadura luzonensis]